MNNIIIYTKAYCPYCVRAKALLKHKNVEFTEFDIGQQPELRNEMIDKSNGSYTVPQIFIGGKHIGGCDEMMALEAQGRLDLLLNELVS
ncbi:glutaredoxin 3 [Pseudoalteromonas denitrificans]|uniref:Glutaredoxin n=1 Tax=Pseudoalteromonas denitrificans DSM 6059 TaxID=1123010 RepID=A0A1I1NYF3_9GAMM|nr:glutaredoxin 3 [Pseudoalteromonas denitrificans]SFD02577.1 glutaredoxin 3 [Pseudoalteromonas denitrificans DSM 6059]